MRTKPILAALSALAIAATLSACSGADAAQNSDGPANLRVWFMQDSIPENAQEYLVEEFERTHKGSTLKVEVQQWDGIAQKLQTSLPSEDETPDIVETGNTQTTIFSSVGAFTDITDLKEDLGGDNLVQSFIDSATWEDALYGVPLYAGSRSVYYRTDLFEKAGIEIPETLDELQTAIAALGEANPDAVEGFSPIYLSANDVHAVESWLFANEGSYAVEDGDEWAGDLESENSVRGLTQLQDVLMNHTAYAMDSTVAANGMYNLFNEGKVGMMVGTLNVATRISPELLDSGKVGMFAFPSATAGEVGATFAGGSNASISAASQNQDAAAAALEIIMGKKFQSLIATDGGWVPGNLSYADALEGPFAETAQAAVESSVLTPNTPQWGVAVANNLLPSFFTRLAKGEDPETVAKDVDATLEKSLNSGD